MKKKIIGLLVILAIMAAVPLIFNNYKSADSAKPAKNNTLSKEESVITNAAAYIFRKHYSDETMKAAIIILNTNYKVNKIKKDECISRADFIKKYKDGEKYYSNLEKYTNELKDDYITYKNKPVYIPCFKVSKGYTEKDKKYPYLKAAACPWDRLKKESKNSENAVGISINTVDKLCKNGLNYKQAVEYFLNA